MASAPAGNLNADGKVEVTIAASTAFPTGYNLLMAVTVRGALEGSVPARLLFSDYGMGMLLGLCFITSSLLACVTGTVCVLTVR